MSAEGLLRGQLTEESVNLMRERIGYPNPTVRSGILTDPWNKACTDDAVRRWALSFGDDNPLYVDPDYAAKTRWGCVIAPPAFEKSMGFDRSPTMTPEFAKRTSKALRGVQLFYSGGENFYHAPITEGMKLYRSKFVESVSEKESKFAKKSAIVTNGLALWDDEDRVVVTGTDLFVHTERRTVSNDSKIATKDTPAFYTDEQLDEIEAAYENEFRRGAGVLYLEDVEVGQVLPRMVKGPFTVTDLINLHMGAGWLIYGNPPYRLAYENRKAMRGFYSRDEFNAWDTVQRVHWDKSLAEQVGVPGIYDIGAIRQMMLCHYCTNWAGDDGWVWRTKFSLRNFNYVGDTTWLDGKVTAAYVDEKLGPRIEIDVTGTNQRGQINLLGSATILVASHKHGPVRLPETPPMPEYRAR